MKSWSEMSSEERRQQWRSACSMCMGTDCEAECREGRCYFQEQRRFGEDQPQIQRFS